MTESQLNLIARSCGNARFHAYSHGIQLLLPTLRCLGPRLDKMRVHCIGTRSENHHEPEELAAAWNLCPNLKELEGNNLNVKIVRAIMATPKDHLKKLSIHTYDFDEEGDDHDSSNKTILNIITEGTKNVETFCFDNDITSIGIFDKLIGENKSTLRYFSVNNKTRNLISQSDARKLVECPFPSRNLCTRSTCGECIANFTRTGHSF